MKKLTLALGLLATLSAAACCKTEVDPKPNPGGGGTVVPDPNPNPNPNPTPQPGTIVLTMPNDGAAEYSFNLTQLAGDEIETSGQTAVEDITDNGKVVGKKYTAPAGATVTFKGKIKTLNIAGGQIEKADLSQAPKTLTAFGMRQTGTKSIDLSGATELRNLIYRHQETKVLDLSKQNKVINMELGLDNVGNNGPLEKVVMPSPSDVEFINISDENVREMDLSNLPKLRSLRAYAVKLKEIDLRNSPLLQELYFTQGAPEIKYGAVKTKNTPNLVRVFIQGVHFSEVSIENAPMLGNARTLTAEELKQLTDSGIKVRTNYHKVGGLFFNGECKLKKLTVTGTAITDYAGNTRVNSDRIEELDLEGNKLTVANLGNYPNSLTRINLGKNMLTEESMGQIADAIHAGEAGKSEIKLKDAMGAGKAIPAPIVAKFTAKSWNVKL